MDNKDPVLQEVQTQVQVCFQCQTCTSGCPVFRALNTFKPATIAQQLARGETVPYIGELPAYWLCAGCYTCEAKCPQHVDLAHIFFKLKNWAVAHGGPVPKGIVSEAATMRTGKTVVVAQTILDRRKTLGLPDLPQADLHEIEKILIATKFQTKVDELLSLSVSTEGQS
jgi:heterodisulfide reductase subunit C